jgi:nucleoside-diphosphate-sugar epimerase
MNILITGICGFVGSNMVVTLKEQHAIYGLDIVSPLKDEVVKTYGWHELEQIPPVDVIIHLAGKAHDTKNTTGEKAYFDINVGLTRQIFEYFLQSRASKFILFSSVKAVTDRVKGEQLTEEETPNPQTPYGKSKLAAEEYILSRKPETSSSQSSFSGLRTSDKKVFILRPCMIHGPGNKGNLNLLYQLVSKSIPWPLGIFENKRSFTSIDNLAFVINQLIENDIEPGIYQVADDEPISTNQLIGLISASKNKNPVIWRVNKKLIKYSARLGDLLHLPLNTERLKKLTESYVVSNQKLKKALGIEKMPVGAEEGMKKTLESL